MAQYTRLGISKKIFDLCVLTVLGSVAVIVTIIGKLSFVPSTILFFAVPTMFLGYRLLHRKQWHHLTMMSLVFGGLYGFLFSYLAERNLAWAWPAESFIPGTTLLFVVVNPAAWLWVFLWITYIVFFYEYFFERDTSDRLTVRVLYALSPGLLVLGFIFIAEVWYPELIEWEYAYAILTLLTLPPCVVLIYLRPHIWLKLIIPALFFAPLHMSHELVGLMLGQWYFPGSYLASIPITENAFVPIEEFVAWILLGSIIVVSYYELYIDDEK